MPQWAHGFHKLTVAFSSISLSQYGCFYVGTLFLSRPFCTTLNLQLSFYLALWYNSRAHRPLLQCQRTKSIILAGAHSYFVVSSFKFEGKNSCHDLIHNPRLSGVEVCCLFVDFFCGAKFIVDVLYEKLFKIQC